jgi:anti-sigma factor RsiW
MKKKLKNCREVYRHLCANLDERLDTPACREFKEHIAQCPNCAAYLDSLKKTVYLYRQYPVESLSRKKRRELYAVLKLPIKKR